MPYIYCPEVKDMRTSARKYLRNVRSGDNSKTITFQHSTVLLGLRRLSRDMGGMSVLTLFLLMPFVWRLLWRPTRRCWGGRESVVLGRRTRSRRTLF